MTFLTLATNANSKVLRLITYSFGLTPSLFSLVLNIHSCPFFSSPEFLSPVFIKPNSTLHARARHELKYTKQEIELIIMEMRRDDEWE